MSKKKKRKNNQRNLSSLNKEASDQRQFDAKQKKILDGVDLLPPKSKEDPLLEENLKEEKEKELSFPDLNKDQEQPEGLEAKKEGTDPLVDFQKQGEIKEEDLKKQTSLNERIQTLTSIFFTIVIFIALLLLIFVLYNNYLKKENSKKIDVNEVCKDYIEKDYHIALSSVSNFIKNYRGILYNIETFNGEKITNADLLSFTTYYLWSIDSTYLTCNREEDSNCLTTKKEMKLDTLKEEFKKFLDISNVTLEFPNDFKEDDTVRLYLLNDTVTLTFSEFTYQTLKHDLIETRIEEDKVYILFALSKQMENSDLYHYVGYKKVVLQFKNDNFLIKSIETSRKE